MKIAYSPEIFQMQSYGGVSRYIVDLFKAVSIRADAYIFASRTSNGHIKACTEKGYSNVFMTSTDRVIGRVLGCLRDESDFSVWVSRHRPDVIHRSYYPIREATPRSIPTVVTLHDMLWETQLGTGSWNERMNSYVKRRALDRADKIICISEFSRSQLIEVWPSFEGRSSVIHHGVYSPQEANAVATARFADMPPYFLYVGTRDFRKNFSAALNGLSRSGLKGTTLYCVGGGAFSAGEIEMIRALGVEGRVIQERLSDSELEAAYAHAIGLLYPSKYEGFGMPLLEAMQASCPVISARSSALLEVGGDAALFVDPDDREAWGGGMADLAENAALRDGLVARGKAQVSRFSWDTAAQCYLDAYRTLVPRGD